MRPDFSGNHLQPLSVTFTSGQSPPWPAVCNLLARRGVTLKMRMIDGQPAFPDEAPPDEWREIRIAATDGMVTLRREGDRVSIITWGNAGRPVLQIANALAWAFAAVSAGQLITAEGSMDARTFLQTADLPESVKTASAE
jgi:hypothetical protein